MVLLGCGPAASAPSTPQPPSPVQGEPPAQPTALEVTPSDAEVLERRTASEETRSKRPWMGVELRQDGGSVLVSYVLPNGPARRAGLQPGDTLLRLGEHPIARVADVLQALADIGPGGSVPVVAQREGKERLFRVEVEVAPTRQALMEAIYVGQPAPSISSLTTLQGTVVPSLERLRGNVVVLEFWASFCTACRALTPELNRWHREREVLGQRVLGVTMDPIELAQDAVQHFEMEYSVQVDSDGEVTRAFRGTALPSVFLIDRDGIVRDVVVGLDYPRLKRMYELAGSLLAEPSATPK